MSNVVLSWESSDYELNVANRSESSAALNYLVYGAGSESEAVSAALAVVPETFEGLDRLSISVQERLTETEWKVQVNYGIESSSGSSSPENLESQFNFEITTENRRTVRSLKQVAKFPAYAPDSRGINDGEGIDIVCPVSSFTETIWLRPSMVTTAWKRKVMKMVGTMNSGAFRGYNAGELLFCGCTGNRNGDSSKDLWQVSFRFAFQANEENVSVGEFVFPEKKGWDVLWCRFREKTVEKNGYRQVIRQPAAAYIEQVYKMTNFNEIGL